MVPVFVVMMALVVVLDVGMVLEVRVQFEVLLGERMRMEFAALMRPRKLQRKGAPRLRICSCTVWLGLKMKIDLTTVGWRVKLHTP